MRTAEEAVEVVEDEVDSVVLTDLPGEVTEGTTTLERPPTSPLPTSLPSPPSALRGLVAHSPESLRRRPSAAA